MVLQHLVVLIDQGAHVGLEAARGIDRAHREAKLDVVFWIGADNKVDVTPIGQQAALDIAHDVGQGLFVDTFESLVCLRRDKVTIQLF